MRITIEGLMGITKAAIELATGKITEVVGRNASGKTSLATAVQAVITQSQNPLGVPATETRKWYLRDGDGEGEAVLEGDGVYARWAPAAGEMEANGNPTSSPEAAGLIDFCARRGAKERAALFQGVLLPKPEEVLGDLEKELKKLLAVPSEAAEEFGAENKLDLKGILKTVNTRGWEAAESVYVDRRAKLKRDWRDITGENHGVNKAADWLPDGWLSEYDGLTENEAETQVTKAREAFDQLHRIEAVSEKEISLIEEAADAIPDLETKAFTTEELHASMIARVRTLEADEQALEKDLKGYQDEYNDVEPEEKPKIFTVPCPHCGEPLVLRSGQAHKPDDEPPVDESKEAWRVLKMDELAESITTKTRELHAASQLTADNRKNRDAGYRVMIVAQEKLADARRTAARKDNVVAQTEDGTRALAEAEQAIEAAKAVVNLVTSRGKAENLHRSILQYDAIATALGPKGVRSRKMATGPKEAEPRPRDTGRDHRVGLGCRRRKREPRA